MPRAVEDGARHRRDPGLVEQVGRELGVGLALAADVGGEIGEDVESAERVADAEASPAPKPLVARRVMLDGCSRKSTPRCS